MKVYFIAQGGRYGYGFNYFCSLCDAYLGCTSSEFLEHPSTKNIGLLSIFKKPIENKCPHAGHKWDVPKHEIGVSRIVHVG